jgi:arylsulfatase A-like enzyme
VARDAPARLADVAPTVLDLVGLPAPSETDGTSLVPLFEARHAPAPEPVYALSRPRVSDPFRAAVFHWPWKYIVTERGADPAAREEELYDLSADPGETRNVAALHRDVCGRFEVSCAAWLGRELPEVAPSVESLSDEDRERLRALGYIGP